MLGTTFRTLGRARVWGVGGGIDDGVLPVCWSWAARRAHPAAAPRAALARKACARAASHVQYDRTPAGGVARLGAAPPPRGNVQTCSPSTGEAWTPSPSRCRRRTPASCGSAWRARLLPPRAHTQRALPAARARPAQTRVRPQPDHARQHRSPARTEGPRATARCTLSDMALAEVIQPHPIPAAPHCCSVECTTASTAPPAACQSPHPRCKEEKPAKHTRNALCTPTVGCHGRLPPVGCYARSTRGAAHAGGDGS